MRIQIGARRGELKVVGEASKVSEPCCTAACVKWEAYLA